MKNVVVVDTSIAIKWVIDEEDSDLAEALLLEWSSNGITLYAPSLLTYELSNVLYRNIRKGAISIADARRAFAKIRLTGIELDFPDNYILNAKAVELANKYDLPAAYDAHFLALAEREGCELWTADTRMWRAVQGKISWVRNLHEYEPAKDLDDENTAYEKDTAN